MVLKDDSPEIEAEMDSFLKTWKELAAAKPDDLSYGLQYMVQSPPENGRRLLRPFGVKGQNDYGMETMTSLRNIDSSIAGHVIVWEDE